MKSIKNNRKFTFRLTQPRFHTSFWLHLLQRVLLHCTEFLSKSTLMESIWEKVVKFLNSFCCCQIEYECVKMEINFVRKLNQFQHWPCQTTVDQYRPIKSIQNILPWPCTLFDLYTKEAKSKYTSRISKTFSLRLQLNWCHFLFAFRKPVCFIQSIAHFQK